MKLIVLLSQSAFDVDTGSFGRPLRGDDVGDDTV